MRYLEAEMKTFYQVRPYKYITDVSGTNSIHNSNSASDESFCRYNVFAQFAGVLLRSPISGFIVSAMTSLFLHQFFLLVINQERK